MTSNDMGQALTFKGVTTDDTAVDIVDLRAHEAHQLQAREQQQQNECGEISFKSSEEKVVLSDVRSKRMRIIAEDAGSPRMSCAHPRENDTSSPSQRLQQTRQIPVDGVDGVVISTSNVTRSTFRTYPELTVHKITLCASRKSTSTNGGRLGISTRRGTYFTPALRLIFPSSKTFLLVKEVENGSFAEEAGIVRGDILCRVSSTSETNLTMISKQEFNVLLSRRSQDVDFTFYTVRRSANVRRASTLKLVNRESSATVNHPTAPNHHLFEPCENTLIDVTSERSQTVASKKNDDGIPSSTRLGALAVVCPNVPRLSEDADFTFYTAHKSANGQRAFELNLANRGSIATVNHLTAPKHRLFEQYEEALIDATSKRTGSQTAASNKNDNGIPSSTHFEASAVVRPAVTRPWNRRKAEVEHVATISHSITTPIQALLSMSKLSTVGSDYTLGERIRKPSDPDHLVRRRTARPISTVRADQSSHSFFPNPSPLTRERALDVQASNGNYVTEREPPPKRQRVNPPETMAKYSSLFDESIFSQHTARRESDIASTSLTKPQTSIENIAFGTILKGNAPTKSIDDAPSGSSDLSRPLISSEFSSQHPPHKSDASDDNWFTHTAGTLVGAEVAALDNDHEHLLAKHGLLCDEIKSLQTDPLLQLAASEDAVSDDSRVIEQISRIEFPVKGDELRVVAKIFHWTQQVEERNIYLRDEIRRQQDIVDAFKRWKEGAKGILAALKWK